MPPSNTSLTHKQFILLFSEAEHELMRYLMALLPNASDARDVLQETAVALWQTIEKYDQSQLEIPPGTRSLVVSLAAGMASESAAKALHYLDDIQVRLVPSHSSN